MKTKMMAMMMHHARPEVRVGLCGGLGSTLELDANAERTRWRELRTMCEDCVHSGETCCLTMRVGGHVGGYISLPPGPRYGGSDRGSRRRTVGPN